MQIWAFFRLTRTRIELHSRLSSDRLIRPLLPKVLYQSIDANTWPKDSNRSPRYLPNNSQAVLVEASHPRPAPSPPNSRSLQYRRRCQLFRIPVTGELVIGRYGIAGYFSRKIANMSDYKDSLLKYHGLSFTLFVNFVRFHLLGWILSTQRRLLLTASYVGRIHSLIRLQITTATPTVTIQLPITSLYHTFHAPTWGYIRHRKTGISPLLPSYPILPKKKPVKMTARLP